MKKKITNFRPMVRSRHPTHNFLRDNLNLFKFRSVVRLGSTTDLPDTISNGGNRIEINTIRAIRNSASKILMKQCFTAADVKTADWFTCSAPGFVQHTFNMIDRGIMIADLPYPIVAKHIYGSRGTGNTLLNNQQELEAWLNGKSLTNYIFEKFYNFNREYRLHVTKDGCFYTCRKMLKSDTPENQRWYRNDSNSVWILEENESFDKPINWDNIVQESIKALNAVGLDIGAIDLKVQSTKDSKDRIRENPDFIIIEINSAPSFGEITKIKYKEKIEELLNLKSNER